MEALRKKVPGLNQFLDFILHDYLHTFITNNSNTQKELARRETSLTEILLLGKWYFWERYVVFLWLGIIKKESEVAQSCPNLCDRMDCSLPGSSLHGILQARVLERVDISFSRGSSQLRDQTGVSHIPGRRFNLWATREVELILKMNCVYKFCSKKFTYHLLSTWNSSSTFHI